MISQLLPAEVCTSESRSDRTAVLFPEEFSAVQGAAPRRQREFASVRACARDAMAALGHPLASVPVGERGAPIWPAGLVGSMTHCEGYRAAAVARSSVIASVGIDAEPNLPLPVGVLSIIAGQREREALSVLPLVDVAWDRLLFSAKESVYKTWFPLTHRWLGFEQAEVVLAESGTFACHLLVPGLAVCGRELKSLTGHWCASAGMLLTAIALPVARQ